MEQSDMRTDGATADASRAPSSQTDASDTSQGIGDRARDIAGTTRDKLADVGGAVRDRASDIKDSLANALESGADKLRHRAPGGVVLAGEAGASRVSAGVDHRSDGVSDKVAGGMEATADWLREADLGSLSASIERQVKEHPGRTLLIAVGLGYLLGKALRK
jgi:hypothetical protein